MEEPESITGGCGQAVPGSGLTEPEEKHAVLGQDYHESEK